MLSIRTLERLLISSNTTSSSINQEGLAQIMVQLGESPTWQESVTVSGSCASFCVILGLVQSPHLGTLFGGATYLVGYQNTFETRQYVKVSIRVNKYVSKS